MKLIKTKAIIEQHLHGAYGVDFLNCSADELLLCAKKLQEDGVTVFLPTLATAPIEILRRQIGVVKSAIEQQKKDNIGARIYGVNLEACFISPEKRGIHDVSQLLAPTIDNFKLIEDAVIKLVTVAPELDEDGLLQKYLHSKQIKVFAGHTQAFDLGNVDGVTHLFNAMAGIQHRSKNTVTSALLDDNLYCEVIADGFHVNFDNIKLVLKTKPSQKVIFISDALPIAKSDKKEMEFCSKKIYLNEGRATDKDGTLAGSSMLLADIIRKAVKSNLLSLEEAVSFASNSSGLFDFKFDDYIYWDEDLNIVEVQMGKGIY